jgi:hypothetical protein
MDFIERVFGVSPDGGSGVLEFVLFLVPIVAATLVASIRIRRARRLHAWSATNCRDRLAAD